MTKRYFLGLMFSSAAPSAPLQKQSPLFKQDLYDEVLSYVTDLRANDEFIETLSKGRINA